MFLKRGERALRRMIAVCGFVSARERRPEKLRLLFRAVMGLVVMEFLAQILSFMSVRAACTDLYYVSTSTRMSFFLPLRTA